MYLFCSYICISNCFTAWESLKVSRYLVNKSGTFRCIFVLLIQKINMFLEARLEEVVSKRYKNISNPYIYNPLMTKVYLSDLRTQLVPRSEHSLPWL